MRAALSIFVMLTVAPLVAVTTLVCWNPSRWGGPLSPLAIPAMAVFGLFTTPLWPTYIPALVLTPLAMRRIAALSAFRNLPLALVVGMSLVIGAVAGFAVISIIVPWGDSPDLIGNWVSAGAASGAITLAIISLIYRRTPRSAESGGREG